MLRSPRLSFRGVPTLHTDAVGPGTNDAPPDAFGPFRVLHQIGAGSLGPVYRAYEPELDRLVAVKMFHLTVSAEHAQQFATELDKLIAADLTHPGIAAPLGAGLTNASPYLALDFVAADSLDTAIRDNIRVDIRDPGRDAISNAISNEGPAPFPDAVRVVAQLAEALDFAAAVDIVHGALHPRDVLISPDDTRLTGLGIVRALELIDVAGPIRVPYTAPERVAGQSWDRRADIFSLAAIAFELLWGRPLAGFGGAAVETITPVSGADTTQLRRVFECALARNPADRFDTALGFADALKTCFFDSRAGAGGLFAAASDDRNGRLFPELDPAGLSGRDPDGLIAREFPFLESAATDPDGGLRLSLDSPDAPHPTFATDLPGAAADDDDDDDGEHDFSLRAGEVMPFDEPVPVLAATAPSAGIIEHDIERPVPPAPVPPSSGFAFSEYAAESSRSAVWPLVLALLVGVAVGAAATFLLMNRERPIIQASAQTGGLTTDPAAVPTDGGGGSTPEGQTDRQARPEVQAPGQGVAGTAAPAREFTEGAVPTRPAPAERPPVRAVPSPRVESPEPRERVPAATEPGRLLVRSTPAGARVFVDGKNAGVTPVTLRDLEPGSHTVRILRDGYQAAERRVAITSTRPAPSVTVALARTRAPQRASVPVPSTPATVGRSVGVLFVESRPVGANVFVDDKMVGTTPMQMEGVDSGAHVVRLEREGYHAWSSAIRVVPGERLRVSASLER